MYLMDSGILGVAFPNFTSFILSEFEELEAVPTLAVMDGPLEPTSSTAANAADVSDDPSFINFFSVCFLFLSKFLIFVEVLMSGRRLSV